MFGSKKRIAELEAANANLNRRLQECEEIWRATANNARAKDSQIEYLVRTIRDMDQLIFNMSQCSDFNGMRPYFTNLAEGMITRKRTESDRIGELIRPELIKTYAKDQTGPMPMLKHERFNNRE